MDAQKFKYAISLALKTLYGDMGYVIPIDVLKYREIDRRAFIRGPLSDLVKVWSALSLFSRYDGLECTFRVYKNRSHQFFRQFHFQPFRSRRQQLSANQHLPQRLGLRCTRGDKSEFLPERLPKEVLPKRKTEIWKSELYRPQSMNMPPMPGSEVSLPRCRWKQGS